MTANECAVLVFFRQYLIQPDEMLCFNAGDLKLPPDRFQATMHSLMQRGFVIKERPQQAYSLTKQGYWASLSIDSFGGNRGKTKQTTATQQ